MNGRKFFYGGFTSGHGEQACASCHVPLRANPLGLGMAPDPTGIANRLSVAEIERIEKQAEDVS